jgi:diguanylate cyclase
LLQRADVAMYDAKAASTERIEVYAPSRDVNTVRRLGLANDLRRAIETNELELHYQPKARLSDGKVHSVEALIRWRHPEYGMVSPDEFVPLAERTGLIQPFTHFVIRQGLLTMQEWALEGRDLGMSINLSMRNLLDASLPGRVSRLLTATHVDPALVTFEVTETSMMAEPAKALKTLTGLADLGVHLSIDDFGTGHSSLSYLQQLPVHEVKIDRSFIAPLTTRPASRAIVDSVIHLAHSLGLKAVAEGVEDQETWNMLNILGCDDVQGYFLCRPIASGALRTWLDQRPETAPGPAPIGLRVVSNG